MRGAVNGYCFRNSSQLVSAFPRGDARGVAAYYTTRPDPADPAQRVAFGTSGHRGTSSDGSFNEDHILAICQAISEYRAGQATTGPLFAGMDTHALSEPALWTAIEVFAANGVELVVQRGRGYTPTPVISHAILTWNRDHAPAQADGVVITPSHLHRRRLHQKNLVK